MDGGRSRVELPRPMVRHKNAICPMLKRQQSIVVRHDAFGEDGEARDLLDLWDDRPVDIVVFVVGHVLGQARLLRGSDRV